MFASSSALDNLTVIVDRNHLQLSAPTEKTNGLDDLGAKMRSFNLSVSEIDGHCFSEIFAALDKDSQGKPKVIIADTVKGKGVSFMENRVEWHGALPNKEQAALAYKELGGRRNG